MLAIDIHVDAVVHVRRTAVYCPIRTGTTTVFQYPFEISGEPVPMTYVPEAFVPVIVIGLVAVGVAS